MASYEMLTLTITDNSNAVLNATEYAIFEALSKIGKAWKENVKQYVPVDTGNLRDSMKYNVDTSNKSVTVGTDVYYGVFQELGTFKMRAHPFIQPSIMNHREDYKKIVSDTLKTNVSEAIQRGAHSYVVNPGSFNWNE